jgi:dTDP-4-amino-4,6-dideoxygalactose transaminase
MSIPLLDLKAQYLSLKGEIDKAVIDVLESGHYILGPNVKALEEEVAGYCGVKYGIGVANGTDALLLSLVAYGIGAGDEVITSPFTFFASAEVISQVGATPVFVDIDPKTFNMDVNQLEAKITAKTKAIIPVHIFGQMADMDRVMEIAKKHNLIVIEDACQAIGSEYKGKKAGSIGHTGCFSFFPTKNLGGFGDGGIIVTNDEEVAKKIKVLRAHGSNPKYYHSMIGWNSRLDEIQAAVLRIKLNHLDKWNGARRNKAAAYDQLLAGTDYVTPFIAEENVTVYHLYIIRAKNRDELMKKFGEAGVGTGAYYPVPLHLQAVYAGLGYKEGSFPVAEAACKEAMALPLYPELTDEAMQTVVGLMK